MCPTFKVPTLTAALGDERVLGNGFLWCLRATEINLCLITEKNREAADGAAGRTTPRGGGSSVRSGVTPWTGRQPIINNHSLSFTPVFTPTAEGFTFLHQQRRRGSFRLFSLLTVNPDYNELSPPEGQGALQSVCSVRMAL